MRNNAKPGEIVCLLSKREAMQYEKSGNPPSCANHAHITLSTADDLVRDDVARWVGGPTTKVAFCRAIVKVDVFRDWRNRPSDGFTVRQLVKIKGRQSAVQNTVERPRGQRRPPTTPFEA